MTVGRHTLRRFRRDERGSTLVELAIILPLTFLMIFAIVDYGRLHWLVSSSRKATEIAVRVASVRPPICAGLPEQHEPAAQDPASGPARFGTLCRAEANVCASVAVSCSLEVPAPGSGDTAGALRLATSDEIWRRIEPLMPPGSQKTHIRIAYETDADLGFLGGPFTPEITVEIVDTRQDPLFEFVMPLGPLAELASGSTTFSSTWSRAVAFPRMSASLPAEDLGNGTGTN
ncbi:pilus assembly protein [Rhodovulum sp. 12E13]|uniref:TadE/TadG family type IV pilus assembly protein n=1 Tax=Rhodovulum sp. 12E13 TaxID=2203891 RepID=UPI000E142CF3|nr:TadE/TadG family type IV pilus assembly protein [Rhodovulum sp. 12E13]RDC71377.1 pilus assembly protein [Rhodovulum sp. 12E13]